MRNYVQLHKLKLSKASVVYKKEIARLNDDAISGLRNIQQFRNLQFKVLSVQRITRDELCNVYEISKSSDFIWKFVTFPDLACTCALKEILHEMESVFQIQCWTFDII